MQDSQEFVEAKVASSNTLPPHQMREDSTPYQSISAKDATIAVGMKVREGWGLRAE